MRTSLSVLLTLAFLAGCGRDDARPPEPVRALEWDARAAEHLLNRAGFGATVAELADALRLGPEAVVDGLLRERGEWEPIAPVLLRWEDFGLNHMQLPLEGSDFERMDPTAQVAMCKSERVRDRAPFLELFERWCHSMIGHEDPLRDRMTLFWHGFFTTSLEVNKRKFELVHQFQWLRANALGSYAELLHGIVVDPAMLQYLDNTSNYREHPNENLARELMELFSLGEGNYTERDVREAARALTGVACASDGTFVFLAEEHDDGVKTILGQRGDFGHAEFVELLLRQEACARWVAGRLIEYFEGVAPAPGRLEEYSRLLREEEYALAPFLRRLFLDPDFYRAEVVGSRVSAPIEHLVTICRKLDVRPSANFLHKATTLMGQGFYMPPSVKGWQEGLAWITSDALMRRSSCVGLLVGAYGESELARRVGRAEALAEGVVHDDDVEDVMAMEGAAGSERDLELEAAIAALEPAERELFAMRRRIDAYGDLSPWDPAALAERLTARAPASARVLADALLDEWLAVDAPAGTRALATRFLSDEVRDAGLEPDALLAHPEALEDVLPRFAHLVFSLPEAQLR